MVTQGQQETNENCSLNFRKRLETTNMNMLTADIKQEVTSADRQRAETNRKWHLDQKVIISWIKDTLPPSGLMFMSLWSLFLVFVCRTVQQAVRLLFLQHQILSPLGHQNLQMFAVLLHLEQRRSVQLREQRRGDLKLRRRLESGEGTKVNNNNNNSGVSPPEAGPHICRKQCNMINTKKDTKWSRYVKSDDCCVSLGCVLVVCLLCYQVHHHVHRAAFDGVDAVNELLDLVKGGSVGGVIRATSTNQLQTQTGGRFMDHFSWQKITVLLIFNWTINNNKKTTTKIQIL